MPTSVAPPPPVPSPPPARTAASWRPSWRTLALLTVAVAIAHMALLGLAPAGLDAEPASTITKFSTRTIVIAPPAAQQPVAVAAQPAPAAAPAAAPRTARPRAVHPPRPKPAPAAASIEPATPEPPPAATAPVPEPPADATAAPQAPDTPELVAQAAPDAAAVAPSTPASAPAGTPASAAAGAGTGVAGTAPANGGANAAGTGEAPSTMVGTQSLRIPGSVTLDFEATGQTGASPQRGVFGELVWLQDGSRYDGRLTLKAVFFTLLNWRSTGAIGPSGLEPERYSESRKAEVASHFVRDRGEIVFSNNAPSVPLQQGAQDRMSVMMQLGGLLAANPARYPAGTRMSIQTAGTRDADVWVFVVGDEERLSLPAGEYTARKLTRDPRKPFDRKLELWLAPAYGYLPVRIRQTEPNGDFADAQLRKPLPAAPAG